MQPNPYNSGWVGLGWVGCTPLVYTHTMVENIRDMSLIDIYTSVGYIVNLHVPTHHNKCNSHFLYGGSNEWKSNLKLYF